MTDEQRLKSGRYEGYVRNGRIRLEFMAGGDEEQFVDMTTDEALALHEWLGKVIDHEA